MPPKTRRTAKSTDANDLTRSEQEPSGASPAQVRSNASHTDTAQSSSTQHDITNVAESTPAGASAPPRRLESLNRPSGSASGPARPTSAAKPKFVGRRSQAARAELEKTEAKKKGFGPGPAGAETEIRVEAEAPAAGGSQSAGGQTVRDSIRGGRGRGGFMGETQRPKPFQSRASGPFSAEKISEDMKKVSGRRSKLQSARGAGVLSLGSSAPREASGTAVPRRTLVDVSQKIQKQTGSKEIIGEASSAGNGALRGIKTDDGGYISSDEDETGMYIARKNIDELQRVVDLTGDEDAEQDDPFAPVRLRRIPRPDRAIELAGDVRHIPGEPMTGVETAEATSEKQKSKKSLEDVAITGSKETAKRHTTYSSSSDADVDMAVKPETEDGDQQPMPVRSNNTFASEMMEGNALASTSRSRKSPEAKRRGKSRAKPSETATAVYSEDEDDIPRLEIPKFDTSAEVEEWQWHHADLRIIRSELGRQIQRNSETTGEAAMDNAALEKAEDAEKTRAEHMYLFQFPPVLPDLISPEAVKPDPDAATAGQGDGDVMEIDDEPKAAISSTGVKIENGANNPLPKLPTGAVGKLKIHKSGKATLDWGGISFSLGMGTEASFLQSVLLAELPESKPDSAPSSPPTASASGMGQVRGKFVLTPNWDELFK